MARIVRLTLLTAWMCSFTVHAVVSVFVRDLGGSVRLEYKCSDGELLRSFALDLSVDRGRILAVRDYFRGESTAAAQGYGIFPASLRNQVLGGDNFDLDWASPDYTPLASFVDSPADTLPGLGSEGVTLEFAALWDVQVAAARPREQGLLCTLEISEPAWVTVTPNASRGGVVSARPGDLISTRFTKAYATPVTILEVSVQGDTVTVRFSGGELQTATAPDGQWSGTGDSDGEYTDSLQGAKARFYRVFQNP